MTTLLHLTTTPVNPDWLRHQLDAFTAAGYDVVAASTPAQFSEQGTISSPGTISSRVTGSSRATAAGWARRGISHFPITTFTNGVDPAADIRAAAQLRAVLNIVEPDILHTHDPKPGVIGRVVGRWARTPIVVNSVSGLASNDSRGRARRAANYGVERLAAAHSDAELAHHHDDVAALESLGVPPDRIRFVGKGIHLDSFTPSRAGARAARCRRIQLGISLSKTVVGLVSPTLQEEACTEFFEAVKILQAQFREDKIAFVIAGEPGAGPGAMDIEKLTSLADAHDVHFLGAEDESSALLSMIDVLALSFHGEDVSRVAMEAGAMCVPVVASTVGDSRHVVSHGETGLVVGPRRPHHLALALERLVREPAVRSKMGRAARAKVFDEFDQQDVIHRTLAIYEELLTQKGLPVPQPPPAPEKPWYADSIDLVERDRPAQATADAAVTAVTPGTTIDLDAIDLTDQDAATRSTRVLPAT